MTQVLDCANAIGILPFVFFEKIAEMEAAEKAMSYVGNVCG